MEDMTTQLITQLIPQLIPQLRYTDLESAIDFYTKLLEFELAFRYEDFYAGIKVGEQMLHLKLVDDQEPNIDWVRQNGHLHLTVVLDDLDAWHRQLTEKGLALTPIQVQPWGRECVLTDPGGHTLYCTEA